MLAKSAKEAGLPFSLSRWTDLPNGVKWDWFKSVLSDGAMFGFDPRTALPSLWSLKPDDTLGFNFWTKNPQNLIDDRELLRPYKVKIHVTATGWEEVEKGAPVLGHSMSLLLQAADTFGPENVIWRFSPIPLVPDVLDRFSRLATVAKAAGLKKVYLSFLQQNDRLPETRSASEKYILLQHMAEEVPSLQVLLCNDDRKILDGHHSPSNLAPGICAGPEDWGGIPPLDGCGCAIMIDPFAINEKCLYDCKYCYVADKSTAPHKTNTTKKLPVLKP